VSVRLIFNREVTQASVPAADGESDEIAVLADDAGPGAV
jgi:hypothetical protein